MAQWHFIYDAGDSFHRGPFNNLEIPRRYPLLASSDIRLVSLAPGIQEIFRWTISRIVRQAAARVFL